MAAKNDLMGRVARLMADLQDAAQLLDESAATQLGLNLTDLRCARQILQGPKAPSQLAEATGLTRAAISAALDRLESANIATRTADPLDRRRSLVEPTERASGDCWNMGSHRVERAVGRLLATAQPSWK